jgi:hypothetical protein
MGLAAAVREHGNNKRVNEIASRVRLTGCALCRKGIARWGANLQIADLETQISWLDDIATRGLQHEG